MNCTATDPSPTPEATRFTEPWRTSPTAKIPGTLVSSRNGSRSRVQPLGCWPSRMRSGPVRMKPAFVPLHQIRQPVGSRQRSNKDEHRSWPARARSCWCPNTEPKFLPDEFRRALRPRWHAPKAECWAVSLIWSIRYCDMVLGQRIAAHQDDHALRVLGKIHRRLARRIRAAHHVNQSRLCRTALRWRRRRSKCPRPASDRFPELPAVATALRSRSSARGRKFHFRPPA